MTHDTLARELTPRLAQLEARTARAEAELTAAMVRIARLEALLGPTDLAGAGPPPRTGTRPAAAQAYPRGVRWMAGVALALALVLGPLLLLGLEPAAAQDTSWLLAGNALSGPNPTEFLGSTNAAPVVVKTNGAERLRILATGNVGIGTSTPAEQLELTGNLALPPSTASTGILKSGANTLLHTFGTNSFFAGVNAGNLTMPGTTASNTGIGPNALHGTTTGSFNTATGVNALQANTTGSSNTATGVNALQNNVGDGNTAMGVSALQNNAGTNNAAFGVNALKANTAVGNTAVGALALQVNTTGTFNTAVGGSALQANVVGLNNTGTGSAALQFTTGSANTATGAAALMYNTAGVSNTAVGLNALLNNTTGVNNTAVGSLAGAPTNAASANVTGSNNTFIGHNAAPTGPTATALSNATALGANAQVGSSNALVLGGTGASAVSVGIGTTTPQSTLQIVGNYLQLPTRVDAPPAGDCDSPADAGRALVVTTGSPNLYLCGGATGWLSVATQGVACTPRPSVAVTSTPNGDGRLRVTIAAGSNPGTPANLLQALQFTRLDNAVVQIGNQTGVSGNYSIAPPASSLTLYVARAAPGASTVEATVQDSCGPWPTLVGGGPSAF